MNDLHYRPLAVAVSLCLLLAVPALAGAQETPRTTTELDRVEVTGSRIKRAEVEGQVPIQTLTRAEIERTGMNSIGEVLQQLTGSGSALNAKFNSSGNFGFPPDGSGVGAGSAQVDLRHLGAKRVLVLVDGIRWVNESSASGVARPPISIPFRWRSSSASKCSKMARRRCTAPTPSPAWSTSLPGANSTVARSR